MKVTFSLTHLNR